MQDERQHFSLRKLSVGLASVLIGISFMQAGQREVKADTLQDDSQNASAVVQKFAPNNASVSTKTSGAQNKVQPDTQTDVQDKMPNNAGVNGVQVKQSASDGVQNNVQDEKQSDTRVEKQSDIQNSAPNATQNTQKRAANNQTVTTTNLDLNYAKPVNAKILLDSKIEANSPENSQPINVASDPSQIDPSHFYDGAHWTPAGWTNLPANTKVAKKSELDIKWADQGKIDTSTGIYNSTALGYDRILATNANFTIDKNDMKKNNQILIGTIKIAPTDGKQTNDSTKMLPMGTSSLNSGSDHNSYIVKDKDNNIMGHITVHYGNEMDLYFVVDHDVNNLADDPSFSYNFGDTRDIVVNTYYGDIPPYFLAKNHLKYPAHWSVVSNHNILNMQINQPGDNSHFVSNYSDYFWNHDSYDNLPGFAHYDSNWIANGSDPNALKYVWKLKPIQGILPTPVIVSTDTGIYLHNANNQLIDQSASYMPLTSLSIPVDKKADNLTSLDLWNQTEEGKASYSNQADGSFLICSRVNLPNPTQDQIRHLVTYSFYTNIIKPDQADQIINNTVNNTKGWSFVHSAFYINGPQTNQIYQISDVTPDPNHKSLGTSIYQSSLTDGNSKTNLELLRFGQAQYLDDESGQVISTDSFNGTKGQTVDYTLNIPQNYVLADDNQDGTNYKWSADKTKITYTFQDDQKVNDVNPIIIHLKHKHATIIGDATLTKDLYQKHTRTIHYVYDDNSKAHDDTVQTVVFSRTADEDLVTHVLSNFTPWTPDSDYSQISVPVIHGYTASQNVVSEASASPDHDNVLTVTYHKNQQQIVVSYVDDTTGATLDTKTLDGYSGDDAKYSTKSAIDGYKKLGYNLVSNSSHGDELIFDKDDFVNNQTYAVHLAHNTHENNLEHNVTRTIHYVYANGQSAKLDYNVTLNFTGTETIDDVTQKAIKTVWTPETKNFDEVASPLIPGYTANQTLLENKEVTPTSDNIIETVTYNPNKQNIHVVFIDDTTGNTLNTVEKSGYTDTDSGYSTKNDIDSLIAKGYKLVSDGTPKENPTLHFDSDDFIDDQNFTVHVEHDKKTNNLNREVTRTIHYVYRDDKPAGSDRTDKVKFSGIQTIDKVNGHVISTVWTPENKELASVATPAIDGYTPDKFSVDSSTIRPDSDNIAVTVTYNPDTQYAKFNYIDDTTGNQLAQETSHGVTGERDNYSTANLISYYKNKGYDLVSDNTANKTLAFDNDDNTDQVYNTHFTHGIITIDPQNPGKSGEKLNPQDPSSPVYPKDSDNLTRKVDREIDYIYSDGRTAKLSVKDNLLFNNTQKIDKVTGEVISSTWDGPKDFADIATPVIEGYTPDKTSVDNKGVKHDDAPIKVTVTYSADPQHITVIYRDLTDNRILSQMAKDGVSDEDSHYNTKQAIDNYLSDGYLLSNDDTKGKDLVFDHADKIDQTYYVDFTHGSHPYNPEKPNKKDKVNRTDYLADYNTVISYVDSSNKKLAQDKTVQDEYQRNLTIDSVNGNIIKRGDWNLNRGCSNVENPVINGYITAQVSVKPQDMQKNQTINVVYQKLGQVHLVDNNGKEISTPFSYTQDPTDPTKVLVTKVPSVAGYEQVTFTVDPTKESIKDTTVVFNAPSTVTVNYVDSVTGKTIHIDTVKGFATHSSDYSTKSEIQNLVDEGYVLTKDNVPTSIKLTEGDTTYLVSFVHGITSVKHDNPQKQGTPITGTKQLMPNGVDTSDLNRNIVRNITVIDPHTGSHITKQVVTLYRDATVDNVTKSITYTNWNTGEWDEFDTPVVAGYTPSQNNVPSVVVTPDTKDSVVTIHYTANPQIGKISYVDDSGHEVSNTPLQGKTDEKVAVNPVIPHGWVIADGQTIPASVVATPNGIPTVMIKIKHGTVEVTSDKPKTPNDKMPDGDDYPDGVTESDLNREITKTINVVDPHKGLHTTVQTAHLTRNAVVDLVTKAITYGKWSTGSWDEFDTPAVKGYTPSASKVAKSNVDISTKNTTVDITYTANLQKGKISYIDENGKEIGTTGLNGKTDEDVQVKPVIPHGWVIVDGQDIPSAVKAGPDGIPTVSIKIKHGQLVVTSDKPHKPDDKMPDGDNYPKGVSDTDLNRNVTRQIILHMPTGDKQVNQVAKYTRVATIDLVTGKVTYTDWATKHGWDEYVPETVNGYEPSIKKLAAIAKPDKDTKVEISYMAIPSSDNFVPSTSTVPTTPTVLTKPITPNNAEPEKPSKVSKSAKKVSNKKIKKQNNGKVAKNNKVANTGYKGAGKVADNVINSNNASQVANNTISNTVASDNATYNNVAINANSASQVDRQTANNNGQLPQTGENSDKTTALAGILLTSMGIVTAIGVSKRKKRD